MVRKEVEITTTKKGNVVSMLNRNTDVAPVGNDQEFELVARDRSVARTMIPSQVLELPDFIDMSDNKSKDNSFKEIVERKKSSNKKSSPKKKKP